MTKTPDEWGTEFSAAQPIYESLAVRLRSLIKDLLDAEKIDYVQIEARAKTVQSFVEKLNRKGRLNDDPFRSVTDLVGVRVITYYLEDVEKVSALVKREFHLDIANSGDTSSTLASDQFGYRSNHLIATIGNGREELREWSQFKEVNIEFQVRTVLQHAWAAVSHKIDYKAPDDAPKSVRRQLFRLSALFELADEQFSSLRDESVAMAGAYRDQVQEGFLNIPVDATSLEVFMGSSGARVRLLQLLKDFDAKRIGSVGTIIPEPRLKRDISDLVTTLKNFNLVTLADVDKYVRDTDRITEVLRAMSENFVAADVPDEDSENEISIEDLLTQVLFVDLDSTDEPGRPMYGGESILRARDALASWRHLSVDPVDSDTPSQLG